MAGRKEFSDCPYSRSCVETGSQRLIVAVSHPGSGVSVFMGVAGCLPGRYPSLQTSCRSLASPLPKNNSSEGGTAAALEMYKNE